MKTLEIRIELPESTTEETVRLAEEKGREAVILVLQQRGEISFREAAAELGLTYEGYLGLLNDRGLPATHDTSTPATLDRILRGLDQADSPS